MEIIKAKHCDLPEILALQKLAYQSEAELVGDFSIPPLTQTPESLEDDYNAGVILKAVDNGRIIGSVRGREDDGITHIGRLIVHPDFQNRGIGAKLLLEIEDWLPSMRYELFTSDLSEKNLALYQKNGYTEFKREAYSDKFDFVYLCKQRERLEEMSAFFNARADSYNTVHLGHVGGMESKRIIAGFLPDHTKTIIDFGIGTGLELEEIFRRFPDAEVTGLDVAENMLELLKETYPDKNIVLHRASYLDYDFGEDRYDAAVSVMTLHHYTHEVKTELYRRIYNCIRQNGVYVECDYMLSEHEYDDAQKMEDFYFSEYRRLKEVQGLDDDREYHFDTPCTVQNQIKMLLSAGFTSVEEMWRKGNKVVLRAAKL